MYKLCDMYSIYLIIAIVCHVPAACIDGSMDLYFDEVSTYEELFSERRPSLLLLMKIQENTIILYFKIINPYQIIIKARAFI